MNVLRSEPSARYAMNSLQQNRLSLTMKVDNIVHQIDSNLLRPGYGWQELLAQLIILRTVVIISLVRFYRLRALKSFGFILQASCRRASCNWLSSISCSATCS
ncbi:uncharacterized protein LAJ45_04725 [Morchella importuna]|uniref:uncharacterized protein n=1 Tax=Morchella importuna TaxID=1174673 RepID=UPI001E8EE252|nr:uncharacterized protein LAJ45_04725 [Morchella importuna]KAH8151024.1 hypothetical protein LAJ45_04725 [Morchella importuna]